MDPGRHLAWLSENTEWFSALSVESLDVAVPACPGWTVEKVLTHLAFGLGLAYPCALRAAPDCPNDQAFSAVSWPREMPVGGEAFAAFRQAMAACIDAFRATDPSTPCYTYDGPGRAAFWFRRAAIETTLHRLDVVEALGAADIELSTERADDAIAEAVTFALPLAAQLTKSELPAVSVRPRAGSRSFQLGSGPIVAEIIGDGAPLLAALWGRSRDAVAVEGDHDAASSWMTLIQTAFAGR